MPSRYIRSICLLLLPILLVDQACLSAQSIPQIKLDISGDHGLTGRNPLLNSEALNVTGTSYRNFSQKPHPLIGGLYLNYQVPRKSTSGSQTTLNDDHDTPKTNTANRHSLNGRFDEVLRLEMEAFENSARGEEVDLRPLVQAARMLRPSFQTELSVYELASAGRFNVDHLVGEIHWQLQIPEGEVWASRFDSNNQLIVERIGFDQKALKSEPYLGSTILVGPATALTPTCPWRGISAGPLALTISRAIEDGGRKEFAELMQSKNDSAWFVKRFHELLEKSLSTNDPAADYVKLL